jgi:GAF domain-containing protein
VYQLWPPVQTGPSFAELMQSDDDDLKTPLASLLKNVATVLGLCGIGATLAQDGRLSVAKIGLDQQKEQSSPCREAFDTGHAVRVTDAREEAGRWPEFSAAANCVHVAGVAGIPMRLADKVIGVLTLYSSQPRNWSDEDMAMASVLADVATGYVVNASELRRQEQLNEQLQEALRSRIVIEQAKGMMASRHSVTINQAYRLIRRYARNHNARLRVVAEAIVAQGPSDLSPAADRPDLALRGAPSQTSSMPLLTAER